MPISPPTHKRKAAGKVHGEEYNRQRTRGLHTGSKRWRAIRRQVLARDLYQCRDCGKYGDEVDHIDGDSHNNTLENLQTLCKRHHAAKTRREQNSNG
jgi:5-methylcytosine-specific restriction endonuclease McrA